MSGDGKDDIAASLGEAILQMDKVSDILADILADCGGPKESSGHHHHHHH